MKAMIEYKGKIYNLNKYARFDKYEYVYKTTWYAIGCYTKIDYDRPTHVFNFNTDEEREEFWNEIKNRQQYKRVRTKQQARQNDCIAESTEQESDQAIP